MTELIFVGRSDDNNSLIFSDDDGNEFFVAIDEHIVRNLTTNNFVPTIGTSLGVSPRDIQTRVRRGESAESIASDSGEPLIKIERYAGPVYAERHHMAQRAQETFVRRSSGDIILGEIASRHLSLRGIDSMTLEWDSYRRDDARWNVTVTWPSGTSAGVATWIYDPLGHNVVALDDEAKWLFEEASATERQSVVDTKPRLVGLPSASRTVPEANHTAQPNAVDDDYDDDLAPPAWAGPGQPTMPVPIAAPQSNDDSPSWDDILFGSRPNDQ